MLGRSVVNQLPTHRNIALVPTRLISEDDMSREDRSHSPDRLFNGESQGRLRLNESEECRHKPSEGIYGSKPEADRKSHRATLAPVFCEANDSVTDSGRLVEHPAVIYSAILSILKPAVDIPSLIRYIEG